MLIWRRLVDVVPRKSFAGKRESVVLDRDQKSVSRESWDRRLGLVRFVPNRKSSDINIVSYFGSKNPAKNVSAGAQTRFVVRF